MALSPQQIAETQAAMALHGKNYAAIARHLGLARSTVQNRVAQIEQIEAPTMYEQVHGDPAQERGERRAGAAFQMPEGHVLKGVSALVDKDGKEVLRWVKTREDLSVADIVETIREAFVEYEGRAEASPAPKVADTDLLTLIPLADWHVGLFSWEKETGVNWDLKIAEATIGKAMDDLVDRSPASANAIVLGGGDLLHADNQENRTARSGNALDVDGRYQRVLMTACRLVVRTVDACLRKHQHVTVRILPGNHDEHSSVAVAYFLLAWYRDEPRVTIDTDASRFFWFRFGKVMLGGTHGDLAKAKDMPMIMAHRRAEDWGATKFRYIHTFHLHNDNKTETEGGGCKTEVHRTPAPQDAWHYASGFLSGRSLKAITYHREYGEISRTTLAILEAKKDNAA
jgi:hypothetical protein